MYIVPCHGKGGELRLTQQLLPDLDNVQKTELAPVFRRSVAKDLAYHSFNLLLIIITALARRAFGWGRGAQRGKGGGSMSEIFY